MNKFVLRFIEEINEDYHLVTIPIRDQDKLSILTKFKQSMEIFENGDSFDLYGYDFSISSIRHNGLPEIYSLEEWFDKFEAKAC